MAQPPTIYKPGPLKYLWNYLSYKLDDFKAKLLGYRSYKAVLVQVGTNAPIATVVENTLNIQVTYDYDSPGIYYAFTSIPLFDSSTETIDGRKVEVTITPNYTLNLGFSDVQLIAYPVFFDVIGIQTFLSLSQDNDILGNFCSTTLEIKVYNK